MYYLTLGFFFLSRVISTFLCDLVFVCFYVQPNSFTSARTLVEVFSIFIGRQNNDLLRLHGMVNFMDAHGSFTIFKRDKDDPYLLPQGCNMLPLEGIHDGFIQGDFLRC